MDKLITRGKSVIGRELVVEARADVGPDSRGQYRDDRDTCGDEGRRSDHRGLVNVAVLYVDLVRSFFAQRPAYVAVDHLRIEVGLTGCKRITGIEKRMVVIEKELAMQLVGAGLGKDFNSPKAHAVILGREGVLVDANFANRRFGRQLPAGEAVDINLASIRSGRRSG